MSVVDAWVNLWDEATNARFSTDGKLVDVQKFFGKALDAGHASGDGLVAAMDAAGVDVALVSGSVLDWSSSSSVVADACRAHPGRLRAALEVDPVRSIRATCDAIERAAADPLVAAIRVVPMMGTEPIASRVHYPIYERCEGLGLPVTINVGVPGPKFRARLQDPLDLDEVCIDFPDLVVVGAHMGHPWEALLIRLMMKYDNLHLSTSAYLARYVDPAVVKFMDSSRGRQKLIFASDEPLLPMARALADARDLPIGEEAMAAFLGGNARRVYRGLPDPT